MVPSGLPRRSSRVMWKISRTSTHSLRPPCSGGLSAWHSAKQRHMRQPRQLTESWPQRRGLSSFGSRASHTRTPAMVFKAHWERAVALLFLLLLWTDEFRKSHSETSLKNIPEHVAARGGERNARLHKWTREGVKSSHETATNATPSREMKKQYGAIFSQQKKVHIRSYMIVFTFDRLAAGKKTVFLDFFATVITSSRQQEVSRVTVMRL